MDALKLIPSVFFDVIARVVPGAVAIVVALLFTGTTWASWLSAVLGDTLATSPATSTTLFFFASYVAGQMISPLAKSVQRVRKLRSRLPTPAAYVDGEPQSVRGRLYRWLHEHSKPAKKSDAYDWLRMREPVAGDHCAKIRAEFTMHNGLAVVLLASAALYPFRASGWQWPVLLLLILGGLLSAVRGWTTEDTFQETGEKLRNAAKAQDSSKEQ